MQEEKTLVVEDGQVRFSELQGEKLENVVRSQPLNPYEMLEFRSWREVERIRSVLP